jgi:rubrerythrin
MDSALDALIVALTSIRDQAESALREIESARRERSLSWKCSACGHVKHFTRPAPAEVAVPCPTCEGVVFKPI